MNGDLLLGSLNLGTIHIMYLKISYVQEPELLGSLRLFVV